MLLGTFLSPLALSSSPAPVGAALLLPSPSLQAVFPGLGRPGPAQCWMWGFAEHPVMRKTSISAGHRARQRIITVPSSAGRASDIRSRGGGGGGWDGAPGRAGPAPTPSSSCPSARGHGGLRLDGDPVRGDAEWPQLWVAPKRGDIAAFW